MDNENWSNNHLAITNPNKENYIGTEKSTGNALRSLLSIDPDEIIKKHRWNQEKVFGPEGKGTWMIYSWREIKVELNRD